MKKGNKQNIEEITADFLKTDRFPCLMTALSRSDVGPFLNRRCCKSTHLAGQRLCVHVRAFVLHKRHHAFFVPVAVCKTHLMYCMGLKRGTLRLTHRLPFDRMRCCSRMSMCWMMCGGMSLMLNSALSVAASLPTSLADLEFLVNPRSSRFVRGQTRLQQFRQILGEASSAKTPAKNQQARLMSVSLKTGYRGISRNVITLYPILCRSR